MAPVVRMFSTSLVAVPALSRVDPVTTSGPTGTVMQSSQVSLSTCGVFGAAQEHRAGPERLGPAEGGADKRRGAAGGDPDHDIVLADATFVDGADAGVEVVLRALDRLDQRRQARR